MSLKYLTYGVGTYAANNAVTIAARTALIGQQKKTGIAISWHAFLIKMLEGNIKNHGERKR